MTAVLITYASQYGHTEQYARWISQQLGNSYSCELLPIDDLTEAAIKKADAVVAGLSDYGGFLTGASTLKKYADTLAQQPLALFTVSFSGLEGGSQEKLDAMLTKNIKENLVNHAVSTCHVRGGLDHTRLSLKHKAALAGIRSAIAALPRKSLANQQMLDSFSTKTVDYSSPEQIEPLVTALKTALA